MHFELAKLKSLDRYKLLSALWSLWRVSWVVVTSPFKWRRRELPSASRRADLRFIPGFGVGKSEFRRLAPLGDIARPLIKIARGRVPTWRTASQYAHVLGS
jgi:hypothetical protein